MIHNIDWRSRTFFFYDPACRSSGHCSSLAPSVAALSHQPPFPGPSDENMRVSSKQQTSKAAVEIEILTAKDFAKLACSANLSVFECAFSPCDSNEFGNTIALHQVLTTKTHAASATPLDSRGIPLKYSDLKEVFSLKTDAALPPLAPHRTYDLAIDLDESRALPLPGKIYPLSPDETAALEMYISNALARGWISPSSSPLGVPCFYVKKPNGGLCLCVDYCGLNAITKKNSYPLPLISDLFDQLRTARRFTRLDLPDAYHLVRIKQGDEWKTAFRSKFGTFQYNVVSFGLSNAPSAFQFFMNDILKEYLGKFVAVYLDDILIYSNDPADHDEHVRLVLQVLSRHSLVVNPAKCSFDLQEIDFLGHIMSMDGISMDPTKTAAISSWKTPSSVKDVQMFLGFVNYYRRFIWQFSKIVNPLTALLKKGLTFSWSSTCQDSFEELKRHFASAPILTHFNFECPAIVECDALDFACSGVLSQVTDDGVL